ncbi:MAG: pyruvate:ferredoxin (flavodoxin) oxidoreductase, partial [Actinomycetia bacterium]|nr:pyruvate:ferredoxin (flavodoxin) oxidoreductase [Actinomycetes bacterium]
ENIIIAMGSVTDTIDETVQYLNKLGEKVGLIKVHLYRPFSAKYLLDVLPETVKRIAVLDRTKEPGAPGEPMYLDIKNVFYNTGRQPLIVGGRYGLSSKDTTPSQIKAVFDNLKEDKPKDGFTIGINDDVTHLSLEIKQKIETMPEGTIKCKFWGLGSDGTVGANKNAIKIIGDNTDMYAQGYFAYDSKKSGGLTVSHLRFGKNQIKSTYLISETDFTACHNQSYVNQYDMLKGLKKGGTFLLNCQWEAAELKDRLPGSMKKYLAENDIEFYIIDATDIALDIGLGSRINMIMQAAFFNLAKVIPLDDAVKYMKEAIKKTYGKKGEKIVQMNYDAVDKGIEALNKVEIPQDWKNAVGIADIVEAQEPDYIRNILRVSNRQEGDSIPVSAFVGVEDGTFPQGTSAYEKRGIAVNVPQWQKDNCIQCNQCSYVCPHAAIRPVLLTEDEAGKASKDFESIQAKGKGLDGLKYRIQVSTLDCTGCGNCEDICPAKEKALVMKPLDSQKKQIQNWDFAAGIAVKDNIMSSDTVKGSQFKKPLFEFSGACAGCGETPYAKLVTQLYGERMIIANATGCSSIWGGSAPSAPYTTNSKGQGPAWANSLFEDNAEYGFGIATGIKQIRNKIEGYLRELSAVNIDGEIKEAINEWIAGREDAGASKSASEKLLKILKSSMKDSSANSIRKKVLELKDYLVKKSVWVFGGDGWAYDIGYGGLD